MGGRTLPSTCEHGAIVDWNDFGPGVAERCLECEGVSVPAKPAAVNRILWNERDRDIDEIVVSDVATVHVEQMHERCWWIGITRTDGSYWAGNFFATSRGRMTFSEQEQEGFEWDADNTHEVESPT